MTNFSLRTIWLVALLTLNISFVQRVHAQVSCFDPGQGDCTASFTDMTACENSPCIAGGGQCILTSACPSTLPPPPPPPPPGNNPPPGGTPGSAGQFNNPLGSNTFAELAEKSAKG